MGHVRLWEELEEEERPAEGDSSGWQDQECERKQGVCPLRRYDWPGPVSGWRTLLPCPRAWFLLQTQNSISPDLSAVLLCLFWCPAQSGCGIGAIKG